MHYIYGINSVSEALKARGRAFEWVGMAEVTATSACSA